MTRDATHAEDTAHAEGDAYRGLASYRHCLSRMTAAWPVFAARRGERLRQGLFGDPVEKVAENILEDLLTTVLDWSLADVNLQVDRADIVLSDLGIKRLVLEVKRPGSLIWHRRAAEAALEQVRGYAARQKVGAVAVSDGAMLYAADVAAGGLRDRVLVALDGENPPEDLWWISVHGIYRPCPVAIGVLAWPATRNVQVIPAPAATDLRHPRYHRPAWCFAYVGSADKTSTWKLPYLMETGEPDARRLPQAIQSILSNYRGVKVSIPREAVGDVLVRLAVAAATLRKLPCQNAETSDAYQEAHRALEQLGRLAEVGCC